MVNLPQLAYGLCTFVPGIARIFRGGAGATQSARYCYAVWMRHLLLAFKHGVKQHPKVVAELGPGDSLGAGLAALISGADQYLAFDVVKDASPEQNLKVFEDLVVLFRNKTPIPGEDEFPLVQPKLDDYAFPADLFTDARLAVLLADDRLERIRDAIRQPRPGLMIDYRAPWFDAEVIQDNVIDMVFSQAVLEHASGLHDAYRAMGRWVRPSGWMSHQIDFRCHGTAREWNGHWTFSDTLWNLIVGKRPYMLNREPYSTHVNLMSDNGFRIAGQQVYRSPSRIGRQNLAARFSHVTDDDLTASSAFIQAVKS